MDKEKYKSIVDKYTPKENRLYNGIIAFLIGGLIGVLGQLLLVIYSSLFSIPTQQASIFMIITLIFLSCLFTSLGFFDKAVSFAKCGLIIPITGFAHSMTSAFMDYRKEGFVYGVGSNAFKLAGTVIVYGVLSAWLFGMVRFFIGG